MLATDAGVQMNFVRPDHRIKDRRLARFELATPASIADPAFRTFEAQTGRPRIDEKLDAVGVGVFEVVLTSRVVEPAFAENTLALDLDGTGVFGVVAPLGPVEQMCSPSR